MCARFVPERPILNFSRFLALGFWSTLRDLNTQPAAYKAAALPLSQGCRYSDLTPLGHFTERCGWSDVPSLWRNPHVPVAHTGFWLRRRDSNPQPLGHVPNELPTAPLRYIFFYATASKLSNVCLTLLFLNDSPHGADYLSIPIYRRESQFDTIWNCMMPYGIPNTTTVNRRVVGSSPTGGARKKHLHLQVLFQLSAPSVHEK